MDWTLAIDKHREALRRALALIAQMAGLGGRSASFPQNGAEARENAQAEKSRPSPAAADCRTLPRRLHRAVLRLLRPAEAAARRLILIAAQDVVAPPSRPRRQASRPDLLPKGSAGTGLVSTGISVHALGLANLAPPPRRPRNPFRPLPLLDTLRGLPRPTRVRAAVHGIPRIGLGARPSVAGRPLSPYDRLDATRIALRLSAIADVLDDLPRHALRLARWRRRRNAVRALGRPHRLGPLRPGRPPGWRRRPEHAVHSVLSDLHGIAVWAREAPDTS